MTYWMEADAKYVSRGRYGGRHRTDLKCWDKLFEPFGRNKIRIGGIMKKPLMMSTCNLVFWGVVGFASLASAQTVGQLIPHKVKLESVDCLGKRAVKITEDGQVANGEAYAIVKDAVFHNGAIEVELAGRPAAAPSGSAGCFWIP